MVKKLKKYQKPTAKKSNEVKSDTTTFVGSAKPGDFVLYPPGTSSKRGNVDEALRKALEKNPLPKNKKGGSSTKTKKKK